MGEGIEEKMEDGGIEVLILEKMEEKESEEKIEIQKSLKRRVERGKIGEDREEKILERIVKVKKMEEIV